MYEIRHFFDPPVPAGPDLGIMGIGVLEKMWAESFQDRPGRPDLLCMFFHDESVAGDAERQLPARQRLMIWDTNVHQVYGCRESEWTHSWVHLTGTYLPCRLKSLGIRMNGLSEYPQLEAAFLDCLRALFAECCEASPIPEVLRGILDIFLMKLARGCHASEVTLPDFVRRAKLLLDADYRRAWTLTELAREAGVSASHLSAEFTRHVGTPPMAYVRDLRLSQAASLLRNRRLRVGEAAAEVGYRDIFHFSKAFKQAYGHSPSAYVRKD